MTTTEIVQELTEVIQLCLSSKLREVHDRNTSLTIEVARTVAQEIELRCKEYTRVEIKKLIGTLEDETVPLDEFREFINTINTLLDGSDESEGYQIFNLLVTDVANTKSTLIDHTTSITNIKQRLTTLTLDLQEHNLRLLQLETQETPAEIKDDIVGLIERVFERACLAVSEELNTYRSERHLEVMNTVREEYARHRGVIDISILPNDQILFTCKINIESDINEILLLIDGAEPHAIDNLNIEKSVFSVLLPNTVGEYAGKTYDVVINGVSEFYGVFQPVKNYPSKQYFH